MQWELLSLDGPTNPFISEKEWKLPAFIGRDSKEATLVLKNEEVSRKHCKIEFKNDKLTIMDLESKGGTWLNTVRIEPNESLELCKDDLLQIGPWIFRVNYTPINKIKFEDTRATRATMFMKLRSNETISRDDAWKNFHKKYTPIIAGFAKNANLPKSDIDDIIQEIFSKFIVVLNDFKYDPSRGRFRGFLKTMTVNAVRSRQRKKKELELPESNDPQSTAESYLEQSFEKEWAHEILKRAFVEVRNQFEEKTWESFEMTGLRGIPSSVVAKQLNMSDESVRSAKSRIIKRLTDTVSKIRDQEDEGGSL